MAAEGRSYREIANETGWDVRTVSKHLEPEIRSREATRIRQELFKERLGTHWDKLIEGIAGLLGPVKELAPSDFIEHIASSEPGDFSIHGAVASKGTEWRVSVRVKARDSRVWELLLEHLPRDPMWPAVRRWEEAAEAELMGRRSLYRAGEDYLTERAHWPILERPQGAGPYVLPAFPSLLYQTALTRALGIRVLEPGRDLFREESDRLISAGGRGLAVAPGQTDRVYELFTNGTRELTRSPQAQAATDAYKQTGEASREIHQALDDLQLLPYLPGVCSICGRIEV
ncbi:MAG: hypothetical protein ACE5JL_04270 [Dehalococcoidia bacterium]